MTGAGSPTLARNMLADLSLVELVAYQRQLISSVLETYDDGQPVPLLIMSIEVACTSMELRLHGDEWMAERLRECGERTRSVDTSGAEEEREP